MVDTSSPDLLVDFPELVERRNLIAHLLRNTSEAVYIRGLPGVGKTSFCQKLLDDLVIEFYVIRIQPRPHLNVLRTVQEAKQRAAVHDAVKPVLLAADDTDEFSEAALSALKTLHAEGARLLFCGRGRVVPQIGGAGLRLIDLPVMNLAQTEALIEKLDPAWAARLDKNGRVDLYHETGGVPGSVIARIGAPYVPPVKSKQRSPSAAILAGAGVLFVIVGVGLWQQDRINHLFVENGAETDPPATIGRAHENAAPSAVTEPAPALRTAPVVERVAPDPMVVTESGEVPLEQLDLERARTKLLSAAAAVDTPHADPPALPANPPDVRPDAARLAGGVQEPEIKSAAEFPDPPVSVARPSIQTPALAPLMEGAKPAGDRAQPADMEAPAPTDAVTVVTVQPSATAVPSPLPVDAGDSLPGAAWLNAQSNDRYTLQLMGGRSLDSLLKVVETKQFSGDFAIVVKDLKGAPWYSLVYGSFADRSAAAAEKSSLGKKIPKDAWPRRFRELR